MRITTILFLFVVLFMSIGEVDYAKASETREIYIIARGGEQIYSITDLKNKKICLGSETHHGELIMLELGFRKGVDYEEVKCYEDNYYQLCQKLMNKTIDAFFFIEETPIYGLADSLKHEEVKILPYTEELIIKLKKYGPYEKRTVNYEDYPSLKNPVLLASMIFIPPEGFSSSGVNGGLEGRGSRRSASSSIAQQEYINPIDAHKYIGMEKTVCGTVASANYAIRTKGRPTFLNLDQLYPNQIITVVIWGSDRNKFKNPPETFFRGKTICVTGIIEDYRGKPEIVVRSPDQITVESQ